MNDFPAVLEIGDVDLFDQLAFDAAGLIPAIVQDDGVRQRDFFQSVQATSVDEGGVFRECVGVQGDAGGL